MKENPKNRLDKIIIIIIINNNNNNNILELNNPINYLYILSPFFLFSLY